MPLHSILLQTPLEIEHKSKRTLHSKTWFVNKTTKLLFVSLEQLHCGGLVEINKKPAQTETGWSVKTPHYECHITRFPFEIKVGKHSIKNLDSPDTNFPEIGNYIHFPRCGIRIKFRAEGIDITGGGNWKVNGDVSQKDSMTFNFAPILRAKNPNQYLTVTKTEVPGEILKTSLSDHLEILYRHDEKWWKNLKKEVKKRRK